MLETFFLVVLGAALTWAGVRALGSGHLTLGWPGWPRLTEALLRSTPTVLRGGRARFFASLLVILGTVFLIAAGFNLSR
ncbi:MAG: hypothetical protein KC503_04980 [Myxococcales bacterium]|nr:hypothetical protein [Myxococcales bacterium]